MHSKTSRGDTLKDHVYLSTEYPLGMLRCPACRHKLYVLKDQSTLRCPNCMINFHLDGGSLDLIYPQELDRQTSHLRDVFNELAPRYRDALESGVFQGGQVSFRRQLTARLGVSGKCRILEVGIGTGDNLPYIWDLPGVDTEIHGVDISEKMIRECIKYLQDRRETVYLYLANAEHLPFPDDIFDAVLHFGAVNDFANIRQALTEMLRVVRPGCRVIVCDDGIAPHLRRSKVALRLMAMNPSFSMLPPVQEIPDSAATYSLDWFLGFYYILIITKREP